MFYESSPFKKNIFQDSVVLVTGGSSGIGLEISRQFGLHGATVFISGRRHQVLEDSVDALKSLGIDAHYVQGDVRKYGDCERMVQAASSRRKRLDVVINCAAGNFLSPSEKLSSNGFRTVMEIDALGTFNVSRAAFPFLSQTHTHSDHGDTTTFASKTRRKKTSCIINISATLHYGATWYQVHASAAKAAVDSLTRTLALEWGAHGIRVAGVAPGPIADTAGMAKLAPGAEQKAALAIPLRRMGTKVDIAMACLFIASDAGAYITGHTLVVDGGEWMFREPLISREVVEHMSRSVEGKSRRVGLSEEQSLGGSTGNAPAMVMNDDAHRRSKL